MRKRRRLLRIGEVAEIIRVPIYTLRYWESRFQEVVKPDRSGGGQRKYCERDVEKIREIKRLLKQEGYSISGAQRLLRNDETKKKLPRAGQRSDLNWSEIAKEVTELIREKLSEEIDPNTLYARGALSPVERNR